MPEGLGYDKQLDSRVQTYLSDEFEVGGGLDEKNQ